MVRYYVWYSNKMHGHRRNRMGGVRAERREQVDDNSAPGMCCVTAAMKSQSDRRHVFASSDVARRGIGQRVRFWGNCFPGDGFNSECTERIQCVPTDQDKRVRDLRVDPRGIVFKGTATISRPWCYVGKYQNLLKNKGESPNGDYHANRLCPAANRDGGPPASRFSIDGFRVVRISE
jgi:hypothetical protein